MDDLRHRFGENLRRCRRRAGLSQEAAALRAGLHRTEIGLLESGGRLPRLDTILKVAGGIEVAPTELLDGMIWRPSGYAQHGSFEVIARGRLLASRSERP